MFDMVCWRQLVGPEVYGVFDPGVVGVELEELEVIVGDELPAVKGDRLRPRTVWANPESRSASPVPELREDVLSPESDVRRVLASLTLS